MEWMVLLDEEFEKWLDSLESAIRIRIVAHLGKLKAYGPSLGRPSVCSVRGSRFLNMKELRIQCGGDPWRILFAFDPARRAILLVGGNKRGDKNWYTRHVTLADERYQRHLDKMSKDDAQNPG